ncbi:hypothetical protein ABZ897_49830 [Nonomuraea sp. NPDC046802]|uniref:hypothetical protein n=1 Tax=Nonomuraea sp. NPDC046802 TaxID=3154919 RepID=UPI0033DE5661
MIIDVFRDALGGTSRRLLFTSGIPALIFSAVLLGSTLEAATGTGARLDAAIVSWSDRPASVQTVHVAGFVLVVTLITTMLAAHRVTLLRWAEGYWPGRFGSWLAGRRAARHERARGGLGTDVRSGSPSAYERLYLRYPLPGEPVLPTRLGNLLRSAEDYPRTRYGIDAVLVWPRLFPLLPTSFTAGFASSRARLDAALAGTALSLVFAVAAPLCTVVAGGSIWLAAAYLLAGVLSGLTGYRAALTAALAHGQQIRVAFDLYRGLLLDTVQYGGRPPQPDPAAVDQRSPTARGAFTSAAEREQWEGLCGFWYRNIPIDARVPAPVRTSPDQHAS